MGTNARLAVFLAIVAVGIYIAWNLIPPHFHNAELQDDLDDIVRKATYTPISEEDLKKIVISKAQSENISLKEDQIVIAKGAMGVTITVHYQVHVDMVVYQTDLDFVTNSHNKMIGT